MSNPKPMLIKEAVLAKNCIFWKGYGWPYECMVLILTISDYKAFILQKWSNLFHHIVVQGFTQLSHPQFSVSRFSVLVDTNGQPISSFLSKELIFWSYTGSHGIYLSKINNVLNNKTISLKVQTRSNHSLYDIRIKLFAWYI